MYKIKLFLFPILIILCIIYFYKPADNRVTAAGTKTVVVYSVFPDDFTQALLSSYKAKSNDDVLFQLFDKRQPLDGATQQPDIYLAPREMLIALGKSDKLRSLETKNDISLKAPLIDEKQYWVSFCYDPYVFLVNYVYSRKSGQANLRSWSELVKQEDIVISMEDISSTPEMRYFLAAISSKMGEEEAINYFKALHRKVTNYAKFAISPIRLTTIGEADLAITSRNKVFKYIENDFPAFLITPMDGVPARVFAIGIGKDTKQETTGSALADYLLTDRDAEFAAEKLGYGYLFFTNSEATNIIDNPELLWLDMSYMTEDKQSDLVDLWLQEVRFASKRI